jgi:hypothetical protein
MQILVFSNSPEPPQVTKWHSLYKFKWIELKYRKKYRTTIFQKIKIKLFRNIHLYRTNKNKFKILNHQNIRFKMWNLTKLEFPFIFLDIDAIVFKPLIEILPYIIDKPFIAVNHQNIPNHTQKNEPFLNGGVQLVSKPGVFTYQMFTEQLEPLYCPGAEQALMFTTFKNLNYDYTHPQIGYEWNSCAGFNYVVKQEDGSWKCFSRGHLQNDPTQKSDSIPAGVEIAINHYWDEFKPWKVYCPMYEEFRQIVISEETVWDNFLKKFYKDTY